MKFDDIFSATRYTKAIDVIRKLKTEKKNVHKVLQAELKVVASNLEYVNKLKDDHAKITEKIQSKKDKIEEIGAEMKNIKVRLEKLGKDAEKVRLLQVKIERMKDRQKLMIKE